MESKPRRRKSVWRIGISILSVLLALSVVLSVFSGDLIAQSKNTGATWRNITIGESTTEQVIAEFGPPDAFAPLTYYYFRYNELGERYSSLNVLVKFSAFGKVTYIGEGLLPDGIYLSDFSTASGLPTTSPDPLMDSEHSSIWMMGL